MSEHSVQVVISEPNGRQVRVSWQGSMSRAPLVLQVASLGALPRHELFPGVVDLRDSDPPPALSLQLHCSEPPPPPPPVLAEPPSEAPLAAAWAAERLRLRHAASPLPPLRRRTVRAPGR